MSTMWLCSVPKLVCRVGSPTVVTVAVLLMPGCGKDARLANQRLRDVTVGDVSAYGVTLDRTATPKQVVYVLLKAIVDDYDAGDDLTAREEARDIEFGVSAPRRMLAGMSFANELDRQEALFRIVNRWAPTLGHYRETFRADFDALSERMKLIIDPADSDGAVVLMDVDHPDPRQNPNAGAVAQFQLTREAGYWRIVHVGWRSSIRSWRSPGNNKSGTTSSHTSAAGTPTGKQP